MIPSARTAPTNAAHERAGKTSAGPWGSLESRTGTMPGRESATSTQLPPS